VHGVYVCMLCVHMCIGMWCVLHGCICVYGSVVGAYVYVCMCVCMHMSVYI
jgi:hypothetical protein